MKVNCARFRRATVDYRSVGGNGGQSNGIIGRLNRCAWAWCRMPRATQIGRAPSPMQRYLEEPLGMSVTLLIPTNSTQWWRRSATARWMQRTLAV